LHDRRRTLTRSAGTVSRYDRKWYTHSYGHTGCRDGLKVTYSQGSKQGADTRRYKNVSQHDGRRLTILLMLRWYVWRRRMWTPVRELLCRRDRRRVMYICTTAASNMRTRRWTHAQYFPWRNINEENEHIFWRVLAIFFSKTHITDEVLLKQANSRGTKRQNYRKVGWLFKSFTVTWRIDYAAIWRESQSLRTRRRNRTVMSNLHWNKYTYYV